MPRDSIIKDLEDLVVYGLGEGAGSYNSDSTKLILARSRLIEFVVGAVDIYNYRAVLKVLIAVRLYKVFKDIILIRLNY
jgi:hypothetical protein